VQEAAGTALWEMSHYVNDIDLRRLVAVVTGQGEGGVAVKLTLTDPGRADLGQELVWRQLARPDTSDTYRVGNGRPGDLNH